MTQVMNCLILLVGLVVTCSPTLAMKEEYLDPDRDFSVSVAEDLRRVPKPTVDEDGRAVFERDYLRANHRTSEYTKLQYRAVIEEEHFINLDTVLSAVAIQCFRQNIIITSSKDDEWVAAHLHPERFENNSVLLLGGPQWECTCSNGLETAILRQSTGVPRIIKKQPRTSEEGTRIMIPCIETSPFNFIGKSTVEFFSNCSEVVATIFEGEDDRRKWGNDHNGHFPVLDKKIDIINYNYDKDTGKAEEDPIVLHESTLVDVRCENCYAYLGIGIGFEFQTDSFDLWRDGLIFDDIIPWWDPPSRVEYLRLWVSGEARAEATFVAELNTNDPNGVEWNWLVNGGMKQLDRTEWQSGSFKPWDHGVRRLKRFFFTIGPIPVTIDLHLPVFMRTAIRTDKGKFWVGGMAFAEAETGLVYRGNYDCRMAGCHHISQWRGKNSGWGPYRYFNSGFDQWGPDFELPEQVAVDFALAPMLTVHVWGSMIGAYIMFDNVLTLTFTFFTDPDSCQRRALPALEVPLLGASGGADAEIAAMSPQHLTVAEGGSAEEAADAAGRRDAAPTAMRVDFDYGFDAYFWAGINIVLGLDIEIGPIDIDIVFWSWHWTSPIFEWTDILNLHLFDFCLSWADSISGQTGLIPITGGGTCTGADRGFPVGFSHSFHIDAAVTCTEIDVLLLPLNNPLVGNDVHQTRILPQAASNTFDYYAYSRVFQVTTEGFSVNGGQVQMKTTLDIPDGDTFSAALCAGELVLAHRDSTTDAWTTTPVTSVDCASYPFVTLGTTAMLADGTRQFVFVRRDVHECNSNLDDCDADATCHNTFGSFTCECPTGWVDWSSGRGTRCDADQCTGKTHDCDPAATCTDTDEDAGSHGGFDCACNSGWTDTSTVGDNCAADVPHPSGYWYDGLGLDTTDRECQHLGHLKAFSLWKPCVHSECCADGLVCVEQNEWYAQCLEPGWCEAMGYDQHPYPYTWTCKTMPLADATEPDVDGPCPDNTVWMPCTESKCCADGLVCAEQSKWYSQCLKPGQCHELGYDQLPAPHTWTCAEDGDAVATTVDDPLGCDPAGLWGDCTSDHCCEGGLVCYEQNAWYAQCLNPGQCAALGYQDAGWSCKELSPDAGGSLTVGAEERTFRVQEAAEDKCDGDASLRSALVGTITLAAGLLLLVVVLAIDRFRRRAPPHAHMEAPTAFEMGLKSELTFPQSARTTPENTVTGTRHLVAAANPATAYIA